MGGAAEPGAGQPPLMALAISNLTVALTSTEEPAQLPMTAATANAFDSSPFCETLCGNKHETYYPAPPPS